MALEWYYDEVCLIFNGRMSEGDSVGESIHGKPSVVAVFFTRIGQVKCLYNVSALFHVVSLVFRQLSLKYYANKFIFLRLNTKKAIQFRKKHPIIKCCFFAQYTVVTRAFSVFICEMTQSDEFVLNAFCCFDLSDLSVMARQVNTVLCSAMGCYSTTHCCLHDQSVHTTGGLYCNTYIHIYFTVNHVIIIVNWKKTYNLL